MSSDTVFSDLLPWWIRTGHQYCEYVIFPLSCLLNGSLIGILMTEANADLRAYSRVLIVNCIADLLYSTVAFVTQMEYDMPYGQALFIINGPLRHAPMGIQYVFLAIYTFTLVITLVIMPLVFIFRYYVIVKEYHMSVGDMIKFISFPVLCAVHQAVVFTYGLMSNDGNRLADCARYANFTVWAHDDFGNCMITKPNSWCAHQGMIFASIQNAITYATMVYCTVAVVRRIRRTRQDMSPKTVQLQRQMNRVLFVQMLVPVFTSFVPLGTSVTLPLFLGAHVPGSGIITTWLFSVIPVCSPLCTILFVSNFRRKFFLLPRALAKRVSPGKLMAGASAGSTTGHRVNSLPVAVA